MKRQCEILIESSDGKRSICVDLNIKEKLLEYIAQSKRHEKKFRFIVDIILNGYKNTELYDKEDISDKSKKVTAMKFFKG